MITSVTSELLKASTSFPQTLSSKTMVTHPKEAWNWTNIDVIDLHLDVKDKKVGLATLIQHPYPFLTYPLVTASAFQIRSLKTSSIDTISMFGDNLKSLITLEYAVNLDLVSGKSYQWIMNNTDQIAGLPSTMITTLKSWACCMMGYNLMSNAILTNVLERNRNLSSVRLQLQNNRGFNNLALKLGALEQLKSLTIEGSDLDDTEAALLQGATETVICLLQQCRNLKSLVFRPIPILKSDVRFHSEHFSSLITMLDFSGVNQVDARTQNTGRVVRFRVDRIITYCQSLRILLMPRGLPQATIQALTPHLSTSCPHLRCIHFFDTHLDGPRFAWFMGYMATLKSLNLTDCLFSASDFQSWVENPMVQRTIQSVIVEYGRLEKSPECEKLMSMMPDEGTVNETKDQWIRRRRF